MMGKTRTNPIFALTLLLVLGNNIQDVSSMTRTRDLQSIIRNWQMRHPPLKIAKDYLRAEENAPPVKSNLGALDTAREKAISTPKSTNTLESTTTTPEPETTHGPTTTSEPETTTHVTTTTPEPETTTHVTTTITPETETTTHVPTTTSDPGTTTHVPTTTPEPETTTHVPTTTTPVPTTTFEPTTTPNPETTTPVLTTTPEHVTTTPEPTKTTIKPTTTNPEPTTTTAELTTTAKSTINTPEPETTTPEPAASTTEPASTHTGTPSGSSHGSTNPTFPQTTTTAWLELPQKEILEKIKLNLNVINATLEELSIFVNNIIPSSTETPTASTSASTDSAQTETSSSMSSLMEQETQSEGDVICNAATPKEEMYLCLRLTSTLNGIESFTTEFLETSKATMQQLYDSQKYSGDLDDVLADMKNDTDFVMNNIHLNEFNAKITSVTEGVKRAQDDIDKRLQPAADGDHTLAIVLGTIGGVLGVALIGLGVFMFIKKKKQRKAKGETVTQDAVIAE